MALQTAVDRYVTGMKSIEQLRRSYGEYGRGRLAIRLLQKHAAGQTMPAADIARATGTGAFDLDRGSPGHISAVRPAVVLGAISNFEGFVEEFLAEALAADGHSLGRIARELGGNNLNNPSVEDWRKLVQKYFPGLVTMNTFTLEIDRYTTQANFYSTDTLTWAQAERAASGWMTVRHILTHGGATGLASEAWPPPLRTTDVSASEVLKPESNNRYSLRFRSAVGAARIYVQAARHLADQVAGHQGTPLSWATMPESFKSFAPP